MVTVLALPARAQGVAQAMCQSQSGYLQNVLILEWQGHPLPGSRIVLTDAINYLI